MLDGVKHNELSVFSFHGGGRFGGDHPLISEYISKCLNLGNLKECAECKMSPYTRQNEAT